MRQAVRTTAGVSEPHRAATRGRALPCQKSRMFATWRVFASHIHDYTEDVLADSAGDHTTVLLCGSILPSPAPFPVDEMIDAR